MLLPPTLSSGSSAVEYFAVGHGLAGRLLRASCPVPGPFLSFVPCVHPDLRAANVLITGQFYCRGAV